MARILLIEDDSFIADMYVRVLRKKGHEIDVNPHGEEALEQAKSEAYDVILLDIMLPHKSGVDILEALRGKDINNLPNTKIIITTNFDEPEEDKEYLERMADGYIIKADITPNHLAKIIDDLLKEDSKSKLEKDSKAQA